MVSLADTVEFRLRTAFDVHNMYPYVSLLVHMTVHNPFGISPLPVSVILFSSLHFKIIFQLIDIAIAKA